VLVTNGNNKYTWTEYITKYKETIKKKQNTADIRRNLLNRYRQKKQALQQDNGLPIPGTEYTTYEIYSFKERCVLRQRNRGNTAWILEEKKHNDVYFEGTCIFSEKKINLNFLTTVITYDKEKLYTSTF